MLARPVMAPWPFTNADVRMKSVKPPRTRKGACAFLRGCDDAKEGSETVAVIRVSLPTLPHLNLYWRTQISQEDATDVRELNTGKVGVLLRQLRDEVRVQVDTTSSAGV